MKALIFDGKIVQIEAVEFPVAPALIWVDITGINPPPETGWTYNGVVFIPPPPLPPGPPKSAALLTAEELAADMIKDPGPMTAARIAAIKAGR